MKYRYEEHKLRVVNVHTKEKVPAQAAGKITYGKQRASKETARPNPYKGNKKGKGK